MMPNVTLDGDVPGPGRLILAATPIGDPDDAPPRLRSLLASADVVAAEDTRRLRRLAAALGITPSGRVVSYHEHNEAERSTELVEAARHGATVVVVTDAGMPSVSDPGLRAVRAAADAGVAVTAVPGPSAVLTALALSGLATDRFCFEGFLPRKAGPRMRALQALATEPRTMIFFEAPHRAAPTLAAMATAFGDDRPAAACREMTKTYEEVRREPLQALAEWAASRPVLGELTIVVGGHAAAAAQAVDVEALAEKVRTRVAAGERLKAAVAAEAERAGVSKRDLYNEVTRTPT